LADVFKAEFLENLCGVVVVSDARSARDDEKIAPCERVGTADGEGLAE
jgi:hypothetical protein